MTLRELLRTVKNTEYILMNLHGTELENLYIGDKYIGGSSYGDSEVEAVYTEKGCDILFIRLNVY